MKIFYEKYDDTVQYLQDDKLVGWQPTKEQIVVEIIDDKLILTTEYADGLVATNTLNIIEKNARQLIAQYLDPNMGLQIFMQNPEETDEATLTLINANYIVGRYLRRIA